MNCCDLIIIKLGRKNKASVNLKTGRFDNVESGVIISSVSHAESMVSKRPVVRFTEALFFFPKLLSSHIYCNGVSFVLNKNCSKCLRCTGLAMLHRKYFILFRAFWSTISII